jgi:hypothetical protein
MELSKCEKQGKIYYKYEIFLQLFLECFLFFGTFLQAIFLKSRVQTEDEEGIG